MPFSRDPSSSEEEIYSPAPSAPYLADEVGEGKNKEGHKAKESQIFVFVEN